jgi:hypothetical protein
MRHVAEHMPSDGRLAGGAAELPVNKFHQAGRRFRAQNRDVTQC